MNPIKKIQSIINKYSSQSGKIIRVNADSFMVSTRSGVMTLNRQKGDATHYVVGDDVLINNRTVSGRLKESQSTYVV